ncbi:hypothetical protein OQA88_8842 [Cercophora sp. LCS_1]
MFGNLGHLIPTGLVPQAPPKEVPPPTPVNFPRCFPQHRTDDLEGDGSGRPPKHLASVLQGIIRPTEVTVAHLAALGSYVINDSTITELIPDPAYIPDFTAWEALSADEAHSVNESTRKKINTGALSPGCQAYLERKRELSISNTLAYRAIRRVTPPKGQTQARLGNSFEFFRFLELLSTFWDDSTQDAVPEENPQEAKNDKPEGDSEEAKPALAPREIRFYRTGAGHQMPPDYRQNIVTAFLKLVAYDFGCNASAPRTEPRLYVSSPASSPRVRSSYFSSGCTFIFRTPTTREAARAGIVEGPLAAISARHTVTFPAPRPDSTPAADRDSTLDLARELIAALITAQHRAREGREEKRIGESAWWATKPRWGGGSGGPIGREIDNQSGADDAVGDKDVPPLEEAQSSAPASDAVPPPTSRPSSKNIDDLRRSKYLSLRGSGGEKGAKRQKKSGNLPMYDNYRMVRPPSAAWDKKTKYMAVGRKKGVDYDDVFVVSTLFHHMSVLRVRVPDSLLKALDGEEVEPWGKLEVRRSKWFDFFKAEDRVEAMQLVWSMMNWMMRAEEEDQKADEDVEMGDT